MRAKPRHWMAQVDIERMRKSPSGTVIPAGEGKGRYSAFVPSPLPPKISLDLELLKSLSEADYALGQLAGLGRNIPNPALLIRPFMRKEAVLSSRIEGTQADLKDVMFLEAEQQSLPGFEQKHTSDAQEVLNYVRALEWSLAQLDEFPMSLRLIREAHLRLIAGVRGDYAAPGEFRSTQNWIGPAGCTLEQATFVPPPPHEMQDALAAFERYLHQGNSYPALIRLGLIHYQFEAIHPFIDGNGRVGRLLLTLLLCQWNLLPQPLLYLSAFFERHRDEYYALLLAVSEQGAWEAWLRFFLTGVAEQAVNAATTAAQLLDLKRELKDRVSQASTSAQVLRLVDELFSTPILTIKQATGLLESNYQPARRAIYALVDLGILNEAPGRKRPKVFVAEDILRVLEG